jgi:hypothetical protein
MTGFERLYCCARPPLTPLRRRVHTQTMEFVRARPVPEASDAGARRSRCATGVPGRVTVSCLPEKGELQRALGLGFNLREWSRLDRSRRSDVSGVVYDDMRRSAFRGETDPEGSQAR